MSKRIKILIAAYSFFLQSCASFPSNSFHQEYAEGNKGSEFVGDTIYLKINSYANWSSSSQVNKQVIEALEQEVIKKGKKIEIITEGSLLPESYFEIVSIVDNSAGEEGRPSFLSGISAIWSGLSFFILPGVESNMKVIVKINQFKNNEIVSSHIFSSNLYRLIGIPMLPFMAVDDFGEDLASIVNNISTEYFELN